MSLNDSLDLRFVDQTVARLGRGPEQVIPILLELQRYYRWLPGPALERLAAVSDITPAAIAGVATFYSLFRLQPLGEHLVKVCDGTACHVKGAEQVYTAIRRCLDITGDADTDRAGRYTVQKVFCVGCCTLAPVVQIDDVTYGHLRPDTVPQMLADFARRGALPTEPSASAVRPLGQVRVCLDSCCVARGAGKVHEAVTRAIREADLPVEVRQVACVVMCERAPLLEIALPDQSTATYAGVPPHAVKPLLLHHFRPRHWGQRLRQAMTGAVDRLLTDAAVILPARYASDARDPAVAAFFGPQRHLATEHYGCHHPLDLDEYLASGGFQAFEQCLTELSPEQIIARVSDSGLRGRGGAGFSTGRKWALVRAAAGTEKFVIVNGDEGDPGAFMDRMLMESFPYRVLEGLAIAARAVGASRGYVYVRAEYPFAVTRMRAALAQCAERHLFERPEFRLDVSVFEGAGAFVCGEETALMASIEGQRGLPRLRPPYPAESGLWGRPTLINNVETLTVVPWIIREGAGAFAALGTPASKGTKVFALAGKVVRGGLIEVPMGVTIAQIVNDVGGGIANGRRFKAVLIGGPSGGCIPASLAQTPVDYESLTALGAIMGSGGLVVLDDTDCMVDVARYFLSFCQYESCGKCTFCRIGTLRMREILDRLCTGQAREGDLARLEELCTTVPLGSICGLGRTAPNPVRTTLRYFREEYEAHVAGHCPAGHCPALIRYTVTDRCVGCTLCAQHCPVNAIPLTPYRRHWINPQLCTRCDTCRHVCPEQAIEIKS